MLVVVYNGVREMLKYALRVPFCIALPLYCVHGQILIDKSRIRNFWLTSPPSSEKILERKSTKMNTTPELLLFFKAVFSYDVRYYHDISRAAEGKFRWPVNHGQNYF